jgi:hypothetical protein
LDRIVDLQHPLLCPTSRRKGVSRCSSSRSRGSLRRDQGCQLPQPTAPNASIL